MCERVVKEVMRRELVTCLTTTPIEQVMRRLVEHEVHALVVVDEDGYAVGIVSQTDVLLGYRANVGQAAAPHTAGEIMSAEVITCNPNATLLEAVTLMTRNHIHRLVIAKPNGERVYPLGILSMTDIIRHLNEEVSPPPMLRLEDASVSH